MVGRTSTIFRVVSALVLSSVVASQGLAARHTVPLLPAASPTGPEGFVRVVNHSDVPGEVTIDAFDDAGRWFGPVLLSLPAGVTAHFNSDDLERGNAAKGLSGRTGFGVGDWRLTLSSTLDLEVLAYVRAPDGFLTAMNDVVPSHGHLHRVPVFNPGSNLDQRSLLRVINPGGTVAKVTIEGVDDSGGSPGGPVRLSVAGGASRAVWADELETGAGLAGALGDGAGKWRLTVASDRPLLVMSLLVNPTGHITNLSGAPYRGSALVVARAFRDALAAGGEGPEMVRMRDESFRRGCLTGSGCRSDELPVREVTFAHSFAISRHEITFADWGACVDEGACNAYLPDDEGWGRGQRPVINVSWNDAGAYASWLSRSTGAMYRLPSESEWEYVARAGTRTLFNWGNELGQGRANCHEDHCQDGFANTAPVGSFPANPWGLHDMHGNVQEWVQDCVDNAQSYDNAPTDGTAWEFPNCRRRMFRGGSWETSRRYLRAASRDFDGVDARRHDLGFRVARTLPRGGPAIVPLFPLASDRGPQGFVRVINYSARAGDVRIDVHDDAGRAFGPLTLSLEAGETAHFNSEDLENGDTEKGLSGGVGPGTSQWRLELTSPLDIEVLSYLRTPDGFLTAMQDVAPAFEKRHRIATFNPGSNRSQQSVLRLINAGKETARVVIEGMDDSGGSPGEPVRVVLPAGASRNLAAWELESGGSGLRGALGDGVGKWRLSLEADRPIMVMSLLESPTRHLTNLSGSPQRGVAPDAFDEHVSGGIVDADCSGCHAAGGEAADTRLVFEPARVRNRRALNRRAFRDFLTEVPDGVGVILRKARGEDHAGGIRLTEGSPDYLELERFLELLDEESFLARSVGETGVDYDGDGIANPDDADDDNDGVADRHDAFPGNAAEWADTNGNGRGDNGEFLLAGRDLPRTPDPVEIEGAATLGAPLEDGRIEVTALNGSPIARTRTAADGSFSITLSEALLPEWFLVRASGGVVDRVSEGGQEVLEVRNRGALRAYVGKRHLGVGALRVGPWTEIAFQQVRVRHPPPDGAPGGRQFGALLDGIAGTFPDGGVYDSLVFDGVSSATDETLEALDRGVIGAILAGAPPNEIANRVEALETRREDEGIVDTGLELRRVASVEGTRVLSVFTPDASNDQPEVRQAYIGADGALVRTRMSRLNDLDSAVRMEINHAGGRALALSGRTESLKDVRYNESWLNALADRLAAVEAGNSADTLSIDIDKGIAGAVSDGQLLVRVDGNPPGSDELVIVQDDPIVEWRFGVGGTPLDDDGIHLAPGGVPVRLLSNGDVLVMQFFRQADRDRFAGVDGMLARRALYLWLAEVTAAGGLAHLAGRTWAGALVGAYATHGRVTPLRSALDPLRRLRAGSGVHVSGRAPRGDGDVVPGQEYGLEFVFDQAVTWERTDRRGETSVVACPEYTGRDIERAMRDSAFRKRPAGAAGDLPCHADITLHIDRQDTLEYRIDVPPVADDSPWGLGTACAEMGYDGYSRAPEPSDGWYYCLRREVDRSSRSIGTLTDLEHGFYWVVPRQAVVFEPRSGVLRPGEMFAGAMLELELADDRGLHPRARRYELDAAKRALLPAFDVLSDGTDLILDARASVVGPHVPRDFVDYAWSRLVMEPSGKTVAVGDRTMNLLREDVRWQATASNPVYVVPLSDLGLDGERAEVWIRLEVTAQGESAATTRLAPIQANAWNGPVFERVRQAAEQVPGVDLKPAFDAGVADLTLRVGTAMRPLQLPAARGGDGALSYAVTSALPPGLLFSEALRRLTGTPTRDGAWEIRYQAVDQDGDAAELRFGIRVLARNAPNSEPRLPDIEGRTFRVGERVYWTLPAASGGDDPKTYDLQGTLPPGVQFEVGIRRLRGTTTTAGTYPLRYAVMDRDGDTDVKRFLATVTGGGVSPSAEGWIVGNWRYRSTHEGCDLRGDRRIDVTYDAGVYTVGTVGDRVDAEAQPDGFVNCRTTSGSTTLDLRGYPAPSDYGPEDFLRMFHCGTHLGSEREACDVFVFREFTDDRVVIEDSVGGVLSTYTYTRL